MKDGLNDFFKDETGLVSSILSFRLGKYFNDTRLKLLDKSASIKIELKELDI